jgi:hypothetical protein
MANSSFQLWELRNTCRHGHDDASKQQSIYEQTHCEVRGLYLLQPMVLQQDRVLFQDTVEEHLLSAVPQLRSWIVHNRRLIQHSVKVAKAQSHCKFTTSNSSFLVEVQHSPQLLLQLNVQPHGAIASHVSQISFRRWLVHAVPSGLFCQLTSQLQRFSTDYNAILSIVDSLTYPTCFPTIPVSSQSVSQALHSILTAARQFRWVY